nr:hypothetical protein [Streptomyces sp. SID685]
MFRLVRGTGHILDVLHRVQVAPRIHDGAFSAMDLTARHPRTGELLSTAKFTVQGLAAARELQRELTYDGLRAAEAAEYAALDQGVTIRRGQGYPLRVRAAPGVHRRLLTRSQPLGGGRVDRAVPAQRKAPRQYENRVSALAALGP